MRTDKHSAELPMVALVSKEVKQSVHSLKCLYTQKMTASINAQAFEAVLVVRTYLRCE
jgi:hypothetical protein